MSSPAPNLSPTSFIAGSRTSLSVGTAPIFSTAASIWSSTPSRLRRRMWKCSASSGSMPAVAASTSSSACSPLDSKWAMNRSSASSRRFQTRSSASSRSPSGISPYGVMWFGLTIARSSPASTQWCRKTELRTARAGCETPKETFETPSEVWTPGISALMRRMPSIVATALGRHSSSPVVSVKVRQSKISASGSRPCSSQAISLMRCAISTLRSAVLAMPTSSIVSAISAAPWASASGATVSSLSRPASRLTELTIARPGICSSAASMTSGSVESIWMGEGCVRAMRLTTWRIWSASSWRSVSATQTSSTWAPPSTWSSATCTRPS